MIENQVITFDKEMFSSWRKMDAQSQIDFIYRYFINAKLFDKYKKRHDNYVTKYQSPDNVIVTFTSDHLIITASHPLITKSVFKRYVTSKGFIVSKSKVIENTEKKYTIIAKVLGRWLPISVN